MQCLPDDGLAMPKETLQIALAIIRHPQTSQYLIAQRRSNVHLPGLWEFPGGKCLPGEDPATCAVREAREETGLLVTIEDAWPSFSFEYPERVVMLHPFLCHAATADARPLGNRQVAWVAPNDLPRYPFPAANASLLNRLRENQASPEHA